MFNNTVNVAFFRVPFASSALVFPNILASCSKDLKLLFLSKSALKLVALSLEWNLKPPVVSE